jgi:hypothetical protein
MVGWMDGWMVGWMNGWMDGWIGQLKPFCEGFRDREVKSGSVKRTLFVQDQGTGTGLESIFLGSPWDPIIATHQHFHLLLGTHTP